MFVRDGDGFVGTELIGGGWNPEEANGGTVLALLGQCLHEVPSLVPMSLSRFTADLVRPVPVGRRLEVRSSVVREGKKIQVVDLRLVVDDVEHVRATALRLREADLTARDDVPASSVADRPADALVRPEEAERMGELMPFVPGFMKAVDLRYAPRRDGTGHGAWMRLDRPVVAGEPVTPTAALTATFDYANLIGVQEHSPSLTMINPDVTAHVLRAPRSKWTALTGDTRFNAGWGRGVSTGVLSDDDGPFAFVSISQLIQAR